MANIIGIFDDSLNLENAINQLNAKGYKERIIDQVSIAQEIGAPSGPLFIPGSGLAPGSAKSSEATIDWEKSEAIKIFKNQFSGIHLSDKQLESYINHFVHEGKFVIVKTDSHHAAEVKDILYAANASQVNQH